MSRRLMTIMDLLALAAGDPQYMKKIFQLPVVAASLLFLATVCHVQAEPIKAPGLAAGAGLWVNLWNYPDGDVDSYFARLHAHGVRNYFIQTSRSNTEALREPEKFAAIIDACHKNNIRVIAWSFSELHNPIGDADKLIHVGNFVTQNGQRIDAVGADMESNVSAQHIETYVHRIRQSLGRDYPIVAIVYSPLNRAQQAGITPWKTIANNFNVIAPMTYWSGKMNTVDPYTYAINSIAKIRQLSGRSDVDIHMIGDGMGTDSQQILQFLKGCQSAEATSASLYPNQKVTDEQLLAINKYTDYIQPNTRFRLKCLKSLKTSSAISEPINYDPTQPISRSDFYKLVVGKLHKIDGELIRTGLEAYQFLKTIGHLPGSFSPLPSEEFLRQPVYPREAYALLAMAVEQNFRAAAQGIAITNQPKKAPKRLDSIFTQPAHAAGATKPINYLDAAQMVVEARSGLRAARKP